MKKLFIVGGFILTSLLVACGGNESKPNDNYPPATGQASDATNAGDENPSYDPERGEGKFKNVEVGEKLDVAMAINGEKVYGVKCSSCHKLTDEKLVGPGWQDVTKRHTADWIMNFMTNTDVMIDKDPKAQAQLEICLVRMPNQDLADADARALYEFMRRNDGVK